MNSPLKITAVLKFQANEIPMDSSCSAENITSSGNSVLYSEFRNNRNNLGYDSARQNKKGSIGNESGNALFPPPPQSQ